jgi:NTE family protein
MNPPEHASRWHTLVPSIATSWMPWSQPRAPAQHTLSLALQGGGAHGAFTWGVLDTLLQQEWLNFDGLSGSSAGAMNAVVMASGWLKGARSGARRALDDFWQALGQQMPPVMVAQTPDEQFGLSSVSRMAMDFAGQFAPSQLNPMDINPLRDILTDQVDFTQLRQHQPFKLFVGATHANTGKLRVFREHEIDINALLASACIPTLHHTVMVDGEPYWDGGFSANPALFPLVQQASARDILLVLLTPLSHTHTPQTRRDIEARISALSFSTHLIREVQSILRLQQITRQSLLPNRQGRRLIDTRLHMVEIDEVQALQRHETKLLAHGPFLEQLKSVGQACARQWLDQHQANLGKRGTLDAHGWLSSPD